MGGRLEIEEVARWACATCAGTCVAAGRKAYLFRGIGTFSGPCPWGCGAWIGQFRSSRPHAVAVYTSEEWNGRPAPELSRAGRR